MEEWAVGSGKLIVSQPNDGSNESPSILEIRDLAISMTTATTATVCQEPEYFGQNFSFSISTLFYNSSEEWFLMSVGK